MIPGSIVVVDWRDAVRSSHEPNKVRPAIVVGGTSVYNDGLPHLLVVPLTGIRRLATNRGSLAIDPTLDNRCTKRSFALAWNVQCVPLSRVLLANGHITHEQLRELRNHVAACLIDL